MSDANNDRLWPSFAKPDACEGCPFARRKDPFIPGVGSLQPEIVVIMERPRSHASGDCQCPPGTHDTGDPFVGPAGRVTESSLGGWDGVYRTNIQKCNAKSTDEVETFKAVKHCTEAYLAEELRVLDAAGTVRRVILGGGTAATQFLGECEMNKQNGASYTLQEVEAMKEAK